MIEKQNKARSYIKSIRLPVLVSTAIAIGFLCFLIYSWYSHVQQSQNQIFTTEYSQGLADTSSAFLGKLIEDQDTESIEAVGQRISAQKQIQKVSIYQRDGKLIYQSLNDLSTNDLNKTAPSSRDQNGADPSETKSETELNDSAKNLTDKATEPVIANISYEGRYNGYLIIYFAPFNSTETTKPLIQKDYIIWILGAFSWLIIIILLYTNRWVRRSKNKVQAKISEQQSESPKAKEQNGQLLKALIRRSKKQTQELKFANLIVIKANWSKLNEQDNTKFLRILNRWLPQNGLFATKFRHNLLILGIEESFSPISRNALYSLEACLKSIQLNPQIVLHTLEFGQDIYETFFKVIEPGVWFEKTSNRVNQDYQWSSQKTIDIEIEESNSLQLCQLNEPDAQQRGLIERQVRFLIDD